MSSETTGDTLLVDLETWFEQKKKTLGIAFLVFVFAGFVFFTLRYFNEKKEQAASAALLDLRPPLNATNAPSITAEDYLKIVRDHPSTAAAERAALFAAAALFSDGKYAEAQAQFALVISQFPNSLFRGAAAYGVATSIESQGKRDEALAAYELVVNNYPFDATVADAKLAMARIYESKSQPELALRMLEEVARNTTQSIRASTASQRREQLVKRFPHLNKPATAAAGSTNTSASASTTIKPAAK